MVPQLARNLAAVFGRRISRQTDYSHLAETVLYVPVLDAVKWTYKQEKQDIVELKTSIVNITRMGACYCPSTRKFAEDVAHHNRWRYSISTSSLPGGATVYQLLLRSINRQVTNRVVKNANLALSPTFRYVSIE
ncbi:hypothetical protein TNCV_1540681 [Trichonephila clavipes]|nr:hypothetical protein TNCV_1540681 [Trichonephila clavipes]